MKKETIVDLFPVKIKIHKNFITKKEIENILLEIKKDKYTNHDSLIGDASSSHNLSNNIIKNNKLNNKLNNVIKKYVNILGIQDQIIYNSWVNIQKEGSKLHKHNHSSSPISGALYLKTDNNSSRLYFHNPNPYVYIMDIKTINEANYWNFNFKLENGDLFLFPGWLMHGSNNETNNSKERIVLSFNTIDEAVVKK